jgi:shikimate dehydrogenase
MKTYGLIGRNISYSFSRNFFKRKFEDEHIPALYLNYDLSQPGEIKKILKDNPEIAGLNVTIPYKQEIIPYLDQLDPIAAQIGAVNTIKIEKTGKLIGYNTDYYGFMESLRPHLQKQHTNALILGTGGASKAVAFALNKLNISYKFVSRTPTTGNFIYSELNKEHLEHHKLIINCTPLGTHPNISEYPPIPTNYITKEHLVFDLIYNPPISGLLKQAIEHQATVVNGQLMLELQAEKAWKIWNS